MTAPARRRAVADAVVTTVFAVALAAYAVLALPHGVALAAWWLCGVVSGLAVARVIGARRR